MQINFLKTVVSSIAGQNAAGIVNLLYEKKNVNEFLIAKKLKLTINQTRNILYRLADEGIVSFVRKKDRKKGGWYIYFWTLNTGKGLLKFKENLTKNLEAFKSQLNIRKTERFYHCPNCSIESNEENALLYQYTCPECGEVLQLKDKTKEVESLEKDIAKIEEVIRGLDQELELVTKKEDSVKARKQRVEDKKKSKERALKRKKRESDMKKLKKKKKVSTAAGRKKKRTISRNITKKLKRLLGR